MVISYLFIIAAAFFNAVMDAVENENFFESVFKNYDQKFWYKRESWKYARRIFGYRIDAWHLAKSLWVFCMCSAGVSFKIHHEWWVHLLTMGIIWNVAFVLFYHKLFGVK